SSSCSGARQNARGASSVARWRCSSRGRRAPIPTSYAGGRATTRRSTSRAPRSPVSSSRSRSTRQRAPRSAARNGCSRGSPDSAAAMDVVAIFGPTGIGKTGVASALADLLRTRGEDPVAISADALQVYRGPETPTGAATEEERAPLAPRLLGFVPIDQTFSVGAFAPIAHAEIDSALSEGRRPIVVGGTGLYLRAALTDLGLAPPPPPEL